MEKEGIKIIKIPSPNFLGFDSFMGIDIPTKNTKTNA